MGHAGGVIVLASNHPRCVDGNRNRTLESSCAGARSLELGEGLGNCRSGEQQAGTETQTEGAELEESLAHGSQVQLHLWERQNGVFQGRSPAQSLLDVRKPNSKGASLARI